MPALTQAIGGYTSIKECRHELNGMSYQDIVERSQQMGGQGKRDYSVTYVSRPYPIGVQPADAGDRSAAGDFRFSWNGQCGRQSVA